MVVADLHVHTTNSDGTLELADVPGAARRAGVSAVAITDHDRLHPHLDAPVERHDGVTIVHGIELRVSVDGRAARNDRSVQRIDLLGYGVHPTDALVTECDRLQRNRVERGRAIVECVEDRLGISLPLEIGPGIGRPHVARAIADVTDYDVDSAFAELIGDDCPCFVARDVPSFERGRDLLAEACSLVSLAHPLRYPDPEGALALCTDLDAVELAYPYESAVDLAPVERSIDRYDLLATGGSDAHDDRLGVAGLDVEGWEEVEDALGQ